MVFSQFFVATCFKESLLSNDFCRWSIAWLPYIENITNSRLFRVLCCFASLRRMRKIVEKHINWIHFFSVFIARPALMYFMIDLRENGKKIISVFFCPVLIINCEKLFHHVKLPCILVILELNWATYLKNVVRHFKSYQLQLVSGNIQRAKLGLPSLINYIYSKRYINFKSKIIQWRKS